MSLVTLSFIQFNNYFNKILRKPENPFLLSSYSPYPVKSVINGVAFNENDGVTAYHVVPNDIDDVGDYLLVHESNTILSHWFVTEAKRNRLGQCMVTLQRDLLVDYYETIKSAPAFIERGVLDNDDPMIFNDEGLSFNQIKTNVKPLWDDTRCSWIVGYIAKESNITEGLVDGKVKANVSINSATPDYEYNSWAEAPQILQDIIFGTKKYRNECVYDGKINSIGYTKIIPLTGSKNFHIEYLETIYTGGNNYQIESSFDNIVFRTSGDIKVSASTTYGSRRNINLNVLNLNDRNVMKEAQKGLYLGIKNNIDFIKETFDLENSETNSAISLYEDSYIKVSNTIYKIKKVEKNDDYIDVDFTNLITLKNDLCDYIQSESTIGSGNAYSRWGDINGQVLENIHNLNLTLRIKFTSYSLEAAQLGEVAELTFPNYQNRQETLDAQFDIFAIPLPLKNFGYSGSCYMSTSKTGINVRNISYEVSLAMAQKLAILLGNKIYDLQILPYCPFNYSINAVTGNMVMPSEGIDCKYIYVSNVIKSFIYFCSYSEFESNLYLNSEPNDIQRLSADYMDIPQSGEPKMQKTLKKYRISGGNYASMFDFTPDMNGGVKNFKVYCNYKPYKPFIKVNPIFNYLYGKEQFKDPNGLIVSGDLSATIISDAWTNYLIQNKNFEAMFDRQIQTIEKTNNVTMMNSTFGAISGAISGAATGAVTGNFVGGPYGAIAGAVVGGVASGIGGAIDISNQSMLMQDNLNLQKQMHSYQIDNIKALPDTIQKISSLTVIDKVMPILEMFECTLKEKETFENYIKYNGMSVGRIDTIQNFESNGGFIQGRFIRLEGLSEDYHLANAINTTFQAGFYFEED